MNLFVPESNRWTVKKNVARSLLESDRPDEEIKDLSEEDLAAVAGGFIGGVGSRPSYGLPPNRKPKWPIPGDGIFRPMYGLPADRPMYGLPADRLVDL